MPFELIRDTLFDNQINILKLYLYLKINSSGKIHKNDVLNRKTLDCLDIKSYKTLVIYIQKLINRNWIGYNNKSEIYFIRSFNFISKKERYKSKTAAVFRKDYFRDFKAWCAAVLYTHLYKKAKRSKFLSSASKLQKAKQTIENTPPFLPVATKGFATYYQTSVSNASKLKKLAVQAGFIDVNKNFKPFNLPLEEKQLYKKYGNANIIPLIRQKKEELFIQLSDTIFPHIALSKRKF